MFYILLLICSLLIQFWAQKIKHIKISKFLDFFSIILMFIISGIRYDVGKDYFGYFIAMASPDYDVEIGTRFIIDFLVSNNLSIQWFIFLMSFLTGLFVYMAINVYDTHLNSRYIAIILIFSMILFNSMNISRQFLSISIITYGCYFLQKKPLRFLTLTLFASIFHYTALIFILLYPVILIIQKKDSIIILANVFILFSMINMVFPIISGLFEQLFVAIINRLPKYAIYSERILNDNFYFSSTFFVYCLILVLIINTRRKTPFSSNDKMLLIFSLFYVASMSFLNFSDLTMRLYYYFLIFFVIFITKNSISVNRLVTRYTLVNLLIIGFSMYFLISSIYSYLSVSELNLYPYRTILYY